MENRIREYREKNGYSQGKLGDLCKVTRQTINAIENNKYDPSLELAFNLSYVLGISIEKLFIFKYERNEKK
ncbi:putative transcriptional regulator [Lysinibacillus sp. RC46]|uniref:helix-turn-helix transcriptional regulator n=1 Tax=unclassified Lysinibacillus TaxID=2636778 RepID=UPI00351391BC